jgi:hypothetical protein
VRHGQPGLPIELMVAFLYDQIQRGNPMGFFGMVQVLEGTSVAIALTVADQLKAASACPPGHELPELPGPWIRSTSSSSNP